MWICEYSISAISVEIEFLGAENLGIKMSDFEQHLPLGKPTRYQDSYDSTLLCPFPRQVKRDEIGLGKALPFGGFDLWTAYELSWLNLKGKPVVPQPKAILNKHIQETLFDSVPGVEKSQRVEMPELPVADRITNFNEVDLVISEANALSEASRCLNCCRLCYNPDHQAA